MGKKTLSTDQLNAGLEEAKIKMRSYYLKRKSRTRQSLAKQRKFVQAAREAVPILEQWVAQFPASRQLPEPWNKVLTTIEHLVGLALLDLMVPWSDATKGYIKDFEIPVIAQLAIPCEIRQVTPEMKKCELNDMKSISYRFLYYMLMDCLPTFRKVMFYCR